MVVAGDNDPDDGVGNDDTRGWCEMELLCFCLVVLLLRRWNRPRLLVYAFFFFLSLGWGRGASPRDYHRRWSAPGCAAMSLRPRVINFNFSNVVVASVVVVVLGKKSCDSGGKSSSHTQLQVHTSESEREREREREKHHRAQSGCCSRILLQSSRHTACSQEM